MPRIFVSAGEPSGVNIAATLMRTLKRRRDDFEFAGLGGEAMVEEGLQQIYNPAATATMWLWGNLKRVPAHRRALRASIADWEANRPALMVTVDYQAFHLYMGTRAKRREIPVVHYVSSQFWARRYYTLETIRHAYTHVLCIHAFEKRFYDEEGIPATYVGHPLFERLEARGLDEALVERLKRPGTSDRPVLGVLPGSRGPEIKYCLPVMLDAAKRMQPQPKVLISAAHDPSRERIDALAAASGLDTEVLAYSSGEILTAADVALITSGSASMEAVYYGCPAVVIYRLTPVSYFFAKPIVVSYIAQPNLIAGKEIVPELLLIREDGEAVAAAARKLLEDDNARKEQLAAFTRIRERLLSGPKPSERAADVVMSYLA